MSVHRLLVVALLSTVSVAAAAEPAPAGRDDALLDLLIRKGMITPEEADEVRAEWADELAQAAAAEEKTKMPAWIRFIAWSGDVTLRHESLFWDGDQPDRHGERFRLRLGLVTEFTEGRTVLGAQVATGELNNPVGTFQTISSTFQRKRIGVDRVYVRYAAADWLALWGGKFANPFYEPSLNTQVIWDTDVEPEGLAEEGSWALTDTIRVFATAADGVWDAITSSDWGTGGTDRRGPGVSLLYNLQDWWQLRTRAFPTRKLSHRPADEKGVFPEDLIRGQMESIWKY